MNTNKQVVTSETKPRAKYKRNQLYQLVAEFKKNSPKARALDVWKRLIFVANTGCHDVALRYDAKADALEYLPDPERRSTRTIKRASFERRFYER